MRRKFATNWGSSMSEWYEVALSDLGKIVTGSTPKAEHDDSWGNSLDFVTPSDQRDGSREVFPARRLSNSGVEHLRSRIVPAGSTCFTCIGATIGKVSLLKMPGGNQPADKFTYTSRWEIGLEIRLLPLAVSCEINSTNREWLCNADYQQDQIWSIQSRRAGLLDPSWHWGSTRIVG